MTVFYFFFIFGHAKHTVGAHISVLSFLKVQSISSEALMNVNRNHRNSVFSMLFGTPDVLRELYSAIEGIDVPNDAVVSINTLSDVFFMEKINDLSFTIDNRIVVLIEHQSTINDNMPVRFLMYIGRVYEKITENKKTIPKETIKNSKARVYRFV